MVTVVVWRLRPEKPKVLADTRDLVGWKIGQGSARLPTGHAAFDFIDEATGFRDIESLRQQQQVATGDIAEPAVHAHEVLVRPLALRIEGVDHVVGRCQLPAAARLEQEGDVLAVIIAVRCHHIEGDPLERLPLGVLAEAKRVDRHHEMSVVVRGALVEVDVRHERIARFDPRLVKMAPGGERPED
jgi:hypothetical protein